ncbi:MAG: ABC transporter ATP-binding protein [Oscillospiraceae bacterium]|nr:ABC transporter ATP-binding protein [Oscillospiraceae bacterium]
MIIDPGGICVAVVSAIEIKNLSKSFGDVRAVDNLSFSVREGEFFAFLGVNGAGKSTTISMLCGALAADGGEIMLNGKPISDETKATLGVVFQNSVLDGALTVQENLRSRAALYGIKGEEYKKQLAMLQELLDINELLPRRLSKLSGGQRRRIDIARALISNPKILVLDEPTTGLDPQTRKMLWDAVNTLRSRGLTVLLTTHYMEEAADADYILIIDSGKEAASGTPLELKNRYAGDYINLYGVAEEKVAALGLKYTVIRDGFRIGVENTAAATALILKNPELFSDYEILKGRMDDVFLSVTGRRLGGDEK